VRLPSLAAASSRRKPAQRKVFCTFLVANMLTQANPLQSRNPLVRLAAGVFVRWVHGQLMRMVHRRRSPGDRTELQQLSLPYNSASQLFMETLISERELTSGPPSICRRRGRFTSFAPPGWSHPRHAYLIEALGLLVRRGLNVRLRLAAAASRRSTRPNCRRLHSTAATGLTGSQVPFASRCIGVTGNRHRCAVFPRRGFPRSYEAWAFSLPWSRRAFPASRHRSSTATTHCWWICGLGGLADAIERIIKIRFATATHCSGLRTFREYSLEKQSQRVAQYLATPAPRCVALCRLR